MRLRNESSVGEILRNVESEDLMKFGLIPEFIGRLPVVATLDDLDESALSAILTKPKNALLKQYQSLFQMEDVKLTFTEEAIQAIAKKAIDRKTGARGLRSIVENILMSTMFELPGLSNIEEVIVNEEVVDGRREPVYVYGQDNELLTEQSS